MSNRFNTPVQGKQYQSEYDVPSDLLTDLQSRDIAPLVVTTIDLSVAGTMQIKVPGRAFVPYFWTTGSAIKARQLTGLVTVYVNESNSNNPQAAIPAKHNRGFRGTFAKVFLSWPAQAATSVDFVIHRSEFTPWMTDDVEFTSTGVQSLSVTSPITQGGTATNPIVGIQAASGAQAGALSAADWTTFNNKQNALTLGNLTDAGTDGIVVTGGTSAVVGAGTSLAQHVADTTHNGYLSSTDWNTFNSKSGGATGDIGLTNFGMANNQASVANVTGLLFSASVVRSADIYYSVAVLATSNLFESGHIYLTNKNGSWVLSQSSSGDNSLAVFSVTAGGQVQYTTPNYAGFSSAKMQFRAIVTQSTFAPTDLPNLLAWYKADSLAQGDGTNVTALADSGPGGNNLTQGTVGSQPIFKTAIVNGKPIIRFSGGAKHLDFGSALFDTTKKRTYFIVASRASVQDGGIFGNISANGQFVRYLNNGGTPQIRYGLVGGGVEDVNDGFGNNAFSYITVTHDATNASGGVVVIRQEGSVLGTSGSGTTSSPDGNFAIGCTSSGGANGLGGDIAEIIIYEGAAILSAGSITLVENYLATKYGL